MRRLHLRIDGRLVIYAGVVIGSLLAGLLVVAPPGEGHVLDDVPCSTCICRGSR